MVCSHRLHDLQLKITDDLWGVAAAGAEVAPHEQPASHVDSSSPLSSNRYFSNPTSKNTHVNSIRF